jgi:hypothetical protein
MAQAQRTLTLADRAAVEAKFGELGITHRPIEHPEIKTVAEGLEIVKGLDGIPTKNLFLKDKKNRFYLVTALYDTQTPNKEIAKIVGVGGAGVR